MTGHSDDRLKYVQLWKHDNDCIIPRAKKAGLKYLKDNAKNNIPISEDDSEKEEFKCDSEDLKIDKAKKSKKAQKKQETNSPASTIYRPAMMTQPSKSVNLQNLTKRNLNISGLSQEIHSTTRVKNALSGGRSFSSRQTKKKKKTMQQMGLQRADNDSHNLPTSDNDSYISIKRKKSMTKKNEEKHMMTLADEQSRIEHSTTADQMIGNHRNLRMLTQPTKKMSVGLVKKNSNKKEEEEEQDPDNDEVMENISMREVINSKFAPAALVSTDGDDLVEIIKSKAFMVEQTRVSFEQVKPPICCKRYSNMEPFLRHKYGHFSGLEQTWYAHSPKNNSLQFTFNNRPMFNIDQCKTTLQSLADSKPGDFAINKFGNVKSTQHRDQIQIAALRQVRKHMQTGTDPKLKQEYVDELPDNFLPHNPAQPFHECDQQMVQKILNNKYEIGLSEIEWFDIQVEIGAISPRERAYGMSYFFFNASLFWCVINDHYIYRLNDIYKHRL